MGEKDWFVMESTLTQKDAESIAERLFAAISAGDADQIREVYAPDAVISNNHTPGSIGVEELVAMLSHMRRAVEQMWFEPVRTQVTAMGFVDQHVTHLVTYKGATATLASCMVVGVRDGRIASVEEYANPADMTPLMAELMDLPSAAG
jgi:ketosteroid isomerase-like protein